MRHRDADLIERAEAILVRHGRTTPERIAERRAERAALAETSGTTDITGGGKGPSEYAASVRRRRGSSARAASGLTGTASTVPAA